MRRSLRGRSLRRVRYAPGLGFAAVAEAAGGAAPAPTGLNTITSSNGAWWVVAERDGSDNLVDQTGGGRTLSLPGGSADPVLADHSGSDYFRFPGTSGNYVSVPDSAALSVTGDIDIQAYIALDDWISGSIQYLAGKWADGQRSWLLAVTAGGGLELNWSTTGANTVSESVSATPTVSDGQGLWLRWTLDVDDGAGDAQVRFYQGGSDLSSPSWSQLGATQPVGSTTSIYDGTSAVTPGTVKVGATNVMLGNMYRFIVKDGIDGTTVLDINASDADPDTTTFTEASTNAATATINRSSTGPKTAVVHQPMYLFATDDYLSAADDAVFDVGASDDFSMVVVARMHHKGDFKLAGKRADLTTASAGWVLYAASSGKIVGEVSDGTVETGVTGGVNDFDVNLSLTKLYGFAAIRDVTADTVGSYADETGVSIDTATDGTTATLANSQPVTVGGSGFYFLSGEFVGAAFIKGTAWDATEIGEIADALITANGGTP